MPAGRPTKYHPSLVKVAESMARLGATEVEIAEAIGIGRRTFQTWQNRHEEFRRAIKTGREFADDRVEQSLYHRAVGYSHEAVKIFMPANAEEPVYAPYTEHYPPETVAAIFWLKNRRPATWRDRRESALTIISEAAEFSDAELAEVIAGRSGAGTVAKAPGTKGPDRVH